MQNTHRISYEQGGGADCLVDELISLCGVYDSLANAPPSFSCIEREINSSISISDYLSDIDSFDVSVADLSEAAQEIRLAALHKDLHERIRPIIGKRALVRVSHTRQLHAFQFTTGMLGRRKYEEVPIFFKHKQVLGTISSFDFSSRALWLSKPRFSLLPADRIVRADLGNRQGEVAASISILDN